MNLFFNVLILLLFSHTGSATLARIDSLSTMSQKSDIIVHAKLTDQKIIQDKDGRPITLTTLKVIDGLKGKTTGDTVTIYQVGGQINHKSLHIAGAHTYKKDEELIFFGEKLKDMYVSYGLGLGKFVIEKGKIIEDVHDIMAVSNDASDPKEAKPRMYPSLDYFKEEIRKSIEPHHTYFEPVFKRKGH